MKWFPCQKVEKPQRTWPWCMPGWAIPRALLISSYLDLDRTLFSKNKIRTYAHSACKVENDRIPVRFRYFGRNDKILCFGRILAAYFCRPLAILVEIIRFWQRNGQYFLSVIWPKEKYLFRSFSNVKGYPGMSIYGKYRGVFWSQAVGHPVLHAISSTLGVNFNLAIWPLLAIHRLFSLSQQTF